MLRCRSRFLSSFLSGDIALVADSKNRMVACTLTSGKTFSCVLGAIRHDDMISKGPGCRFLTSKGDVMSVRRPGLGDFAFHVRRSATPAYPKDAAAIPTLLDLDWGDRVLEAGTGSGVLTTFLSRAVGRDGVVVSYDVRPDARTAALKNIQTFFSKMRRRRDDLPNVDEVSPEETRFGNISLKLGSLETVGDSLEAESFDAAVLDMMEPWKCLQVTTAALRMDASVVVLQPNITQVVEVLSTVEREGLPLSVSAVLEVQHREWDVRPPVAHPKFMQHTHTAFLCVLRKHSVDGPIPFPKTERALEASPIDPPPDPAVGS
jgi:tRNA (adenine57-N1/adenine58-N1)-methyltransferase catalytic subunit